MVLKTGGACEYMTGSTEKKFINGQLYIKTFCDKSSDVRFKTTVENKCTFDQQSRSNYFCIR